MQKVTITELTQAISQRFLPNLWRYATYLWLFAIAYLPGSLDAQNPCSMACANANIGISNGCIAFVSPLSVAKVSQNGCDPNTWVIHIRETMNGPVIASGTDHIPAQLDGRTYLNKTLVAEVIDIASGNKCWAFIVLEDKTPPAIVCDDITLTCEEMLNFEPKVSDNCEIAQVLRINEVKRPGNCTIRSGIAVINNGFSVWDPAATQVQDAAFDDLFGAGNWNKFNYSVNASSVFNNQYGFVYLDGGDDNATEFATFIESNRSLIENWVDQGGALFLNAAPNEGGDIDLGFNGVILSYDNSFSFGSFAESIQPSHPIFSGPFLPADGPYTGNYYNHAIVCPAGMNAKVLLRNPSTGGDVLVEMQHGQGLVMFGGMTSTNYHWPMPNADNMRRNVYQYLYENRNEYARGITSVITQTWVAEDHVGLRDTCSVNLFIKRPDIQLISCPTDEVSLTCSGNWAKDANGNPDPSESGFPTYNGKELDPLEASQYCNLLVGYEDLVLPGLCEGERKIFRQWKVSEWFCGEDTDKVCTQLIVLKDTEAPSIQCPPSIQVSTSINSCAQHLMIERPELSDNCSPLGSIRLDLSFNLQYIPDFQGGIVSGFQPGDNIITYQAMDHCGNSSSCSQTITVIDEIAPIAICRTFTTVSMGSGGTARVGWDSFDDGSYDNCSVKKIEVKRMDENDCDPNDEFKPYVEVCCTDVTGSEIPPVMVILRVVDQNDNSNTCMVSLEVQDKLPAQIQCPPDITVQCGFPLDDLNVFGKVSNLNIGEPRNPIIINGQSVGQDGFAYDNCDVFIEDESDVNLTACGAGTVTRIFRAEGFGNNRIAECQQRIQIINDVQYLPQSIVWPCDIMLTNFCTENPSGELTPAILRQMTQGIQVTKCPDNRQQDRFYDRPQYLDDACTQVGVSYKDHVFTFQDSACYKILREWTLIDWCAVEQNPGQPMSKYTHHHIQVIKIQNTVAPTITCSRDQEVCSFQTNCSVGEVLTVSAIASDDCTRTEDLRWRWEYYENNGSIVTLSGNGSAVTRNFPVGTHRVRFVVEDRCGNTNACTSTVTVRDCKQPTPVCHHLIIDLMVSGMVNINATNFNAGSYDNCTPGVNLDYRIERSPFTTPGNTPPSSAGSIATFTCDDLGSNMVRIWVGDQDGNWDFCETTLIVQNNAGANCLGNGGGGNISGKLTTEEGVSVEKGEVYLQGQITGMYQTGIEGIYQFDNIPKDSTFTVMPMKLDEPMNGVSTLDILLIQQHILGIATLNSPYKMIAADVNSSGQITGADLVEIRRLILKSINEFSQSPSWRFIPKAHVFYDPSDPLNEGYKESVLVPNFNGQLLDVDFVAIKMGDVNATAKANTSQLKGMVSRERSLLLEVADKTIKPGEWVEVPIRTSDLESLLGFQFTLQTNPQYLDWVSVEPGALSLSLDNFGLNHRENGYLTASWNATDAQSLNENEVLFTMVFKSKAGGRLSDLVQINSAVTRAEAYSNLDGNTRDIKLVFNDIAVEEPLAFELFQNRPNPFSGSTLIGFTLPEAGEATLSIFDIAGKLIHQTRAWFDQGYQEIDLPSSLLQGVNGVMYYELKTSNASAVKKMVRL